MAAFGLGDIDKMIGYAETQGAAFAVIEGLNAKLEERIAEKGREVAELNRAVEALRVRASPDGRVGQSPKGAAADSEHAVGDLRPTMGCTSTRHRREFADGSNANADADDTTDQCLSGHDQDRRPEHVGAG